MVQSFISNLNILISSEYAVIDVLCCICIVHIIYMCIDVNLCVYMTINTFLNNSSVLLFGLYFICSEASKQTKKILGFTRVLNDTRYEREKHYILVPKQFFMYWETYYHCISTTIILMYFLQESFILGHNILWYIRKN